MLRILIAAVVMLTNQSYHDRIADRLVDEDISGADRFVDASVRLHIVVADPIGEEIIPGRPKLRIVSTSHHGGMIDTKSQPAAISWTAECRPLNWYCSEDQAAVLKHGRGKPHKQLVYGSEGAGKTRLLVMWHYFRWLDYLGQSREGGQTAPTLGRLGLVKQEMLDAYRPNWCRYLARDDFEGFEMCDRTRIRFRYAHQQSAAKGAPIQGYNWAWWAGDEMQDQVEAYEDILSRGRSAPGGVYLQLGTATAKDSPDWRTLRDRLEASGLWARRTLIGPRSPFVFPDHWESMRQTMSEREYKRRVLALDLPPEKATYPTWSRDTNLITVPELGWVDVTANELRTSGPDLAMLVGHDPGTTIDVSLLAKAYVTARNERAYRLGTKRPIWVIRGEVNTEGTTETHLIDLLKTVREKWGLNLLDRKGKVSTAQILVRADPAGNSDNRTDKSVYTQFANAGIRIKPAAYNADNDGHGRVPREAGVELVNTLICNAAGERRLYVERLPDGRPAAPRLVAALESSERDDSGRAEVMRKGRGDTTHWPAALRYMFWAIERPRLNLMSREEA